MTSAQTFHDHIKELRHRILWCILPIGASAGLAYIWRIPLIRFMQHPIGVTLFYTSPAGSFNFILKLSTVIGIFVALPVIIYNLLRFIEPALPVHITRRIMLTILLTSFGLALAGMAFSFFYLLPLSLKFFSGYATAQIKPLISADEYLSFLMGHLITFALMFQIPLVVLFINWIRPIKPGKLLRYQRHVVVGSFALAVILPFTYDPISQFIVAIPIVVLFYLSAVLLWIANRKRPYPDEVKVKQLVPAPRATPILSNTPKPFLQPAPAAKPLPALPMRRSYSMDGFVSRPIQVLPRSAQRAYAAEPQRQSREPVPSQPPFTRKGLTIDGISPPLPSYY